MSALLEKIAKNYKELSCLFFTGCQVAVRVERECAVAPAARPRVTGRQNPPVCQAGTTRPTFSEVLRVRN